MVYNSEVQKRADDKRKNCPIRKAYMKNVHKQPHIIKKGRIKLWKKRGIINDDFNELYSKYLDTKNCELCNIEFGGKGKNKKCLDHDHVTGLFRNVLCNNCNWTVMRNK